MSGAMWILAMAIAAAPSEGTDALSILQPTSGGLTIEQVIDRALETSGAKQRAGVEYTRAKSDEDSAYLLFVPRVDLAAGYARQSKISSPFPGFEIPQNSYSAAASMSIALSDYVLRIIHAYDATSFAANAARLNSEATKDDIALSATEAFVEAIRAHASTAVAEASVGVLTEQLTSLEAQEAAGLVTPGDVLQLRAQLSFARVGLSRAQANELVRVATLERTLHEDTVDLAHGEDLLVEPTRTLPSKDKAFEEAMATRVEIKALMELAAFREKLVKVERAGVFPRLTIDGRLTHAKPNQAAFGDFENFRTTWSIGLNLAWSPNDAVRAWSNWDKAEQDVVGVQADIIQVEDMIAVEVTGALNGYASLRTLLAAAKDGLEAAEGAFDDRQNLLNAGQSTTTELVLAQQALRDAQLQIINVHLDLRLARARLDRALGRLRKGDDR